MAEITIQPTAIDLDALPGYQIDALCRTVTNGVRMALQDEKNRADFERWKQERKRREGKQHG